MINIEQIEYKLQDKMTTMTHEEKQQLIQLVAKLRDRYCEHYNCCFDKDYNHDWEYNEQNLCPLCYGGPSYCLCDELVFQAFHIALEETRHPRIK